MEKQLRKLIAPVCGNVVSCKVSFARKYGVLQHRVGGCVCSALAPPERFGAVIFMPFCML